jgi:hypothetical protein
MTGPRNHPLVGWTAWLVAAAIPTPRDGIPGDARSGVRAEIQTFLTTRRARISAEQADLPAYGGEGRRVSGLRRDEVALLAGISSQYYTKLERGNAAGSSFHSASTVSIDPNRDEERNSRASGPV